MVLWNQKSKNPTWLETSKSADFSLKKGRGWLGVEKGKVPIWNLKSKNPTWLETSKSAKFSFYKVWDWGGGEVTLWNLKSKNPTWLETSKSANFLLCMFVWRGGRGGSSKLWNLKSKYPTWLETSESAYGGKLALWNLKCKNPTQLETSKSANFSFYNGGEWYFEIWSPEIQLNLKLLNLQIFHFTMVGRGTLKSEVQKSNSTWNFQICQLFILHGEG